MVKTGRENKRYSAEFWTNVNKLDSKKGKLNKR